MEELLMLDDEIRHKERVHKQKEVWINQRVKETEKKLRTRYGKDEVFIEAFRKLSATRKEQFMNELKKLDQGAIPRISKMTKRQ